VLRQGDDGRRRRRLLRRGGRQEPAARRAVQLPGRLQRRGPRLRDHIPPREAARQYCRREAHLRSVAKITRLAGELPPERFAVFGGQSDFLIGGLSVGSAGCIAAFANVFPRSIVQIYKLYKEGKYHEALALHQKAALAEQPCKSGIATTKYAAAINTAKAAGIEGAEEKLRPRRPYTEPSAAAKQDVVAQMAELARIEESLR
ncbi:hypothetical protein CHU98_g9477, partial [Xylaria longipes]